MFNELPDKSLWVPSLLLQQVMATFVCPLISFIMIFPLAAVPGINYLFPIGISLFVGFKVQRRLPFSVKAGKWVWVLPVICVLWNICDYTSSESLRAALEYTFWPGPTSGAKGLGVLVVTLPACASIGYVGGLLSAARENSILKNQSHG